MNPSHFYIVLAASVVGVLSWDFIRKGGGR